MNEKFQHSQDNAVEDTEGHGGRLPAAPTDDVEGHMPKIRFAVPADELKDEDTEGHGGRIPAAPIEDDDVEGHGNKLPAAPIENDEVEGHGLNGRV
jgi:hypothetical protein